MRDPYHSFFDLNGDGHLDACEQAYEWMVYDSLTSANEDDGWKDYADEDAPDDPEDDLWRYRARTSKNTSPAPAEAAPPREEAPQESSGSGFGMILALLLALAFVIFLLVLIFSESFLFGCLLVLGIVLLIRRACRKKSGS